MKTIATIQPDFSVTLGKESTANDTHVAYREAVKVILINKEGKVALTHYPKWPDGYSLPGGGIEDNESLEAAVAREIKEETGYETSDPAGLGIIYEFSVGTPGNRRLQKTYAFTAKTLGTQGDRSPDTGEADMKISWFTQNEAIERLTAAPPSIGRTRGLLILKEATKIL